MRPSTAGISTTTTLKADRGNRGNKWGRRPMTAKQYQSTLLMPIITSRTDGLRKLSPLHQSKIKDSIVLSRSERLWKPTNGMVVSKNALKKQQQRMLRKRKKEHENFLLLLEKKKQPQKQNHYHQSKASTTLIPYLLDQSWVKSFELESTLFASPAVWGSTKLMEVLQLCESSVVDADFIMEKTNKPIRMKSIVSIEIFRQLRTQFGTGSELSNMSMFRTLASSIYPSVSPVNHERNKKMNSRTEIVHSIESKCYTCKIKCNRFYTCSSNTTNTTTNGRPSSCQNIYYCLECTNFLKCCTECYSPIEIGHSSTRLNIEPTTKRLELNELSTQNLNKYTINDWLSMRSWYEHEILLLNELKDVYDRRSQIILFNQQNLEEKLKGIRVLEKSTKAWQVSVVGQVFRRWADTLKKMKIAEARITAFFQKLKGVNLKNILHEWSTVVQRDKLNPVEIKNKRTTKEIQENTKEIEKITNRIQYLNERIIVQSDIIIKLNQKAIDKEITFLNADRNPITLEMILHTMTKCCNQLIPLTKESVNEWSNELTKTGLGTYRLGKLICKTNYNQDDIPSMLPSWMLEDEEVEGREKFGNSSSNTRDSPRKRRISQAEEKEILKDKLNKRGLPTYNHNEKSMWTSIDEMENNDAHSDEDVYYPFKTRLGDTVFDILDYIIENNQRNKKQQQVCNASIDNIPKIHNDYKALLNGETYLQLLQSIIKYGSASNSIDIANVQSILIQYNNYCKRSQSENDIARKRCQAVYDGLYPSINLLSVDDMLSIEEEEEGNEQNIGKSLWKGLKNKKNLIVKQTTVINGVKVEMEDDEEQRHFAFLANIIETHCGLPSGSPIDEIQWMQPTKDDLLRLDNGSSCSSHRKKQSDDNNNIDDKKENKQSQPSQPLVFDDKKATHYLRWLQYLEFMENEFMAIEKLSSSNSVLNDSTNIQKDNITTFTNNPLGFATNLDQFFTPKPIKLRAPLCNDSKKNNKEEEDDEPFPLTVPINSMNILSNSKKYFQQPISSLFLKYRTCLYERLQYQDFNHRSSYLSWLGCNQSLLGRDQKIEEDLDDGTFTGKNIDEQITDLFKIDISKTTNKRGLTLEERRNSIIQLHDFLSTHYRSTVMIFEHYAASVGGKKSNSLDRGEFWKLVKDVRLHKTISTVEIDLIFQKSNLDNSMDGNRDQIDTELEGNEFVEAIIRLANCKYKKLTKMNWFEKFEHFYTNDLLKNAVKTNKAGFRENIASNKQIKLIMKRSLNKLKKIFSHFSQVDTQSINVTNQHTSATMNVKELCFMTKQLNMLKPGILTDPIVRTLFGHVQMSENESNRNRSDSDSQDVESSNSSITDHGDDDEMNFIEFKEILCAISHILYPDPWTPSHKKLKLLLDHMFLHASDINLFG
jgi:hypothetical protein